MLTQRQNRAKPAAEMEPSTMPGVLSSTMSDCERSGGQGVCRVVSRRSQTEHCHDSAGRHEATHCTAAS